MKYSFGVDRGGTTVKLAFFDTEGTMLHKWEIPTDTSDSGSHILPDIAAAVKDYLAQKNIDLSDVVGVGIGVPGPVDGNGVVNKCINLGWGVFNIEQELSKLVGLPVRAGNDANMAALGESWMGAGRGCGNVVLTTLGTGVGGGVIIDGKPVSGVHGAAGEIGHIVVQPGETVRCSCGKYGCAEQYCSATGVVRLAKLRLEKNADDSTLRQLSELTCKDVFDAGAAGDGVALEILEQVYDYMGRFLAAVCCTVDPQLVVIGGGVSRAGQPLLEGAQRYYVKYVFHASEGVEFALASLGNDAGAYGACKLILDAQM